MKPSHVEEAVLAALKGGTFPFVWGEPGGGKSALAKRVAARLGVPLVDIRAPLRDPVDFLGLPTITAEGTTRFAPPDELPRKGPALVLLDELPNAVLQVQNALLGYADSDGRIGEHRRPHDVMVMACGNRVQDRAGSNKLTTSLADRFHPHLDYETDHEDWITWGLGAGIATEILAFIRMRPELLQKFDPTERTSPTARSWEAVSKLLPHLPDHLATQMVGGTVGMGAAAEFVGFLKVASKIPDPETCLLTPEAVTIPKDPAVLYALSSALARKATSGNADRFFKFGQRMPDEFRVFMVLDALKIDMAQATGLRQTRAYMTWAADNRELLV